MNCRTVRDRLSSFQDGELSVSERDKVERHLSGCPSCREEFVRLQQTWEALNSLPELSVPPEFYRRVQRKIGEAAERGKSRRPVYDNGWFGVLPSSVAACLLIATGIALGALVGNSFIMPEHLQAAAHEESVLSSLSAAFDPVPPGTLADGFERLMTRNESHIR
jgi:anti-sigma factor RsiW